MAENLAQQVREVRLPRYGTSSINNPFNHYEHTQLDDLPKIFTTITHVPLVHSSKLKMKYIWGNMVRRTIPHLRPAFTEYFDPTKDTLTFGQAVQTFYRYLTTVMPLEFGIENPTRDTSVVPNAHQPCTYQIKELTGRSIWNLKDPMLRWRFIIQGIEEIDNMNVDAADIMMALQEMERRFNSLS